MIAEIGLLVSAYVFVRMLDIGLTHSRTPPKQMRLFAVVLGVTAVLALLIGFGALAAILDGSA